MVVATFNAVIDELETLPTVSESETLPLLSETLPESALKKPRKAQKRDAAPVSPEPKVELKAEPKVEPKVEPKAEPKKRVTLPPPTPLTGAAPFESLAESGRRARPVDDSDALLLTVLTGATLGAALALSGAYLFFQLAS